VLGAINQRLVSFVLRHDSILASLVSCKVGLVDLAGNKCVLSAIDISLVRLVLCYNSIGFIDTSVGSTYFGLSICFVISYSLSIACNKCVLSVIDISLVGLVLCYNSIGVIDTSVGISDFSISLRSV